MRAVISTLLRGLLGVIVTIALVAAVWAGYLHRDALAAALRPVVDSLPSGGPAASAPASERSQAIGAPALERDRGTSGGVAPGAAQVPDGASAAGQPGSAGGAGTPAGEAPAR